MKTLVIACKMIENEILKVMAEANLDYPTVFLKAGLDDKPEELKALIQEQMDSMPEAGRVILGYGFANGTLSDFPAGRHQVVAPQAEDALCLILGSQLRRDEILAEAPSYFISEGWLRGDNIFAAFQKSVDRFGLEKAVKLHKVIMDPYKRFLLIDTGTYDLAPYREKLTDLGGKLGLAVEETKGDLSLLKRLVSGPPWDKDFVVAEPGGTISIDPSAGSVK